MNRIKEVQCHIQILRPVHRKWNVLFGEFGLLDGFVLGRGIDVDEIVEVGLDCDSEGDVDIGGKG